MSLLIVPLTSPDLKLPNSVSTSELPRNSNGRADNFRLARYSPGELYHRGNRGFHRAGQGTPGLPCCGCPAVQTVKPPSTNSEV